MTTLTTASVLAFERNLDISDATFTQIDSKNTDAKDSKEWRTHSVKSGRGWLVPLPVGYQGIAAPFAAGELAHCRTAEYPSQYVETIYSLGKWVFPFRLPENFQQCFWRYTTPQDNLYLITQAPSH